MTEKEYRALHRLSYSWVKLFTEDRVKFLHQYEQEPDYVEKTDTSATTFGSLTETLLLTPERFDEKFENARFKKPTGQMGDFVEQLYRLTLENRDAAGAVNRTMTSLMEEAYNLVAFDAYGNRVAFKRKSLDQVIADFSTSGAERFYRQQREATGKYLVDVNEYGRASTVVHKLRTHWNTRQIFEGEHNPRYTVHKQLVILFTLKDMEFKAMADLVIIDHELKVIHLYDLKTTYEVEDFEHNYRKYRYYLQGLIYYLALSEWKKDAGLTDYHLEPTTFIVADSSNVYDPLLWPMNRTNLLQAKQGFSHRDLYYMGLDQALESIKWHRENTIWTMSKENYASGGICEIKKYADL